MTCVFTLKQKGLKLTPQRRLIAEAIHDIPARLSAEEIISYVQERMPGVNKSTVYRTLELLEDAGCIFKSRVGDGFVYHHAEEGHHHHLVCRKCGKTIDCDEDVLASAEQAVAERYGFQVELKHVVITGLCEDCAHET
jgi:Fur family transcriptional regulator, ferric uptake regulator